MEIIVPKIADRYNDWTDRELVLLSLVFYFYSTDWRRDTTYYVLSHDIKRILGITNVVNPDLHVQKLRRVLRIGLLTWDHWSFELLYDKDSCYANGTLQSCTRKIQDIEAIQVYSYLAGRLTAPDIICEHDGLQEINRRDMRMKPLMGPHFSHAILNEDV